MLEEVTTALQRTATAAGKDAELRARALEVMSLLTFAAEESQTEIDRIMSGLSTVASEPGQTLLLCLLPLASRITSQYLQLKQQHGSISDAESLQLFLSWSQSLPKDLCDSLGFDS